MKGFTDFRFPLRYRDGALECCGIDEDIKQSLYILLSTRRGERLMRPGYGIDLTRFAFESVDYELLSGIENEVTRAIALNEPRVENVRVSLGSDDNIVTTEALVITVSYTVKENAHELSQRISLAGIM